MVLCFKVLRDGETNIRRKVNRGDYLGEIFLLFGRVRMFTMIHPEESGERLVNRFRFGSRS